MSSKADALAAGDVCRPRDPLVARAPFYYGWLMLPLAMIAQIMTAPGQTVGISIFTASLTGTLGISETQLTGAYGLGTFLACLPLAAVGALMDRFGIRRTMTLVVLLLGGACLFMARVQGLVTLFAAFFLLRLLGQGALSLLAGNTPAMWFHRRLGTVTGLMNVGVVLAMGQIPLLIRPLIERFGWRGAYAALGIIVWAVMLPVLAVFFRNRPEDVGLLPDGERRESGERRGAAGNVVVHELNLHSAMRTRSFWIVTSVYVAWAMIGTGLVFNAQQIHTAAGLSATRADVALTGFFTIMAAAQLVGGLLADRLSPRWIVAAAVAAMASSTLLLVAAAPSWLLPAYLIFGAGQGLLGSSGSTLAVRYFGRGHLGKIRGTIQTAAVAGSSVGPFIMGWCFDTFGGYEASLWLFLAILCLLMPAAALATPPRVAIEG